MTSPVVHEFATIGISLIIIGLILLLALYIDYILDLETSNKVAIMIFVLGLSIWAMSAMCYHRIQIYASLYSHGTSKQHMKTITTIEKSAESST